MLSQAFIINLSTILRSVLLLLPNLMLPKTLTEIKIRSKPYSLLNCPKKQKIKDKEAKTNIARPPIKSWFISKCLNHSSLNSN